MVCSRLSPADVATAHLKVTTSSSGSIMKTVSRDSATAALLPLPGLLLAGSVYALAATMPRRAAAAAAAVASQLWRSARITTAAAAVAVWRPQPPPAAALAWGCLGEHASAPTAAGCSAVTCKGGMRRLAAAARPVQSQPGCGGCAEGSNSRCLQRFGRGIPSNGVMHSPKPAQQGITGQICRAARNDWRSRRFEHVTSRSDLGNAARRASVD